MSRERLMDEERWVGMDGSKQMGEWKEEEIEIEKISDREALSTPTPCKINDFKILLKPIAQINLGCDLFPSQRTYSTVPLNSNLPQQVLNRT